MAEISALNTQSLMAPGGVIGSDHGIMSMVSMRPAFGIRGSHLVAINYSSNRIDILRNNGTGCFRP